MSINPHQNHRILVIDDNQAIHEDFRKILSQRPKSSLRNLDAVEASRCLVISRCRWRCLNFRLIRPFKDRKDST